VRQVISLTSIPPRFAAFGLIPRSLVQERCRPEAVELWISGHLTRRGVPIRADRRLNRAQLIGAQSAAAPLYAAAIEGRAADPACVDDRRRSYGVWGGAATQST
jgi:hypothetical protein